MNPATGSTRPAAVSRGSGNSRYAATVDRGRGRTPRSRTVMLPDGLLRTTAILLP